MFGEIIRSFRINNGLSQTNFVDIVQKSSENFDSLDVVTLSRWEREVTTPHLSRQNELLTLIGVNIFDVWESNDIKKSLSNVANRINVDGYTMTQSNPEIKVIRINATNSFLVSDYKNKMELISSYEANFLFEKCINNGLNSQGFFEKIINQYGGELTLILVHGQLIGHILSINSSLVSDLDESLSELAKERCQLILSMNLSHVDAFVPTIGREVYKYLQSLDPSAKLYIYTNNKRMFDILFNLGFEYRSINEYGNNSKLMSIDSFKLKSQRIWMNILSSYKGEEDE